LSEYWFVVVAAFFVLGISYCTASLLHYYGGPCLHISNPRDFYALRISATFPNIVALPILIFPTLCEYSVVYNGFGSSSSTTNDSIDIDAIDVSQLQQSCEDQATTMIFCYFFSWSLAFWSVGHPQLMQAAHMKANTSATTTTTATDTVPEHCRNENENEMEEEQATQPASHDDSGDHAAAASPDERDSHKDRRFASFARVLWNALKQTVTSAGFLAMVAGFLTACVPPLQRALFDPGGALRFLGAALESLGQASSPISTMVVAASMVPVPVITPEPESAAARASREEVDIDATAEMRVESESSGNEWHEPPLQQNTNTNAPEDPDEEPDENPIMSDPNFGPYQRRQPPHDAQEQKQPYRRRLSRAVSRSSIRILQAATRSTPEMRRLHVWFVLSRLVLSPALVVGAIVGLDCGTSVLSSVPPLAKLVVIVNASLPGALVVVVLLKSNPDLAETAAAVAKGTCRAVYSSLLSINRSRGLVSLPYLTRLLLFHSQCICRVILYRFSRFRPGRQQDYGLLFRTRTACLSVNDDRCMHTCVGAGETVQRVVLRLA
jgi:predicted permease